MTHKNDDIFRLRSLAIEKQEARDTLQQDFSDTKERLRPSNLIQEAKNKALDQVLKVGEGAIQGVKDNPGKVASVAAVATLVALGKPLAKHYSNRKSAHSGDEQDDSGSET